MRLADKLGVPGDQIVEQRTLRRHRRLDALLPLFEGGGFALPLGKRLLRGSLRAGQVVAGRAQFDLSGPATAGEGVHRAHPVERRAGVTGEQHRELFETARTVGGGSQRAASVRRGPHSVPRASDVLGGRRYGLLGGAQPQPPGIEGFGRRLGRVSQFGELLLGSRYISVDRVDVVGSGRRGGAR